jgi:chromosomal replication initiation ATPase DnaA
VDGMRIDPRVTFRTVIPSSANRSAIALARRAARRTQNAANPLLLCGRSGTGKSMLLAAIANTVRRRHERLVTITGEELRNAYVHAIRSGTVGSFRRSVDDCDVLIVDQLEDLMRYPTALEELRRAIARVVERGGAVVLASTPTPALDLAALVHDFPRGAVGVLRDTTVGARLIALHGVAKRTRARIPRTTMISIARRTLTIAEARAKLEAMLLLRSA